jgi:formylglycine-generating enzyme required for sulfatase activity
MKVKIPFCYFYLLLIVFLYQPISAQPPQSTDSQRGIKNNKVLGYPSNGTWREVPMYDDSYALVIGMSNYRYWNKLNGPVKDVEEVRSVLTEHSFKVQVEMDLTGEELEDKINDFIKSYGLSKNNRLIIYFAGHGETMVGTDNRDIGYLVPVDAPQSEKDEDGFKRTALSMSKIEGFAKEIQTKHALFIFDSCFSGKLLTFRDGKIVTPAIGDYMTHPVRQFIASGTAKQKVPDESKFRYYFVRGLKGDADVNIDGYITGEELAKFLHQRVTDETGGAQTPQYGKVHNLNTDRGDMVFFLNGSFGTASDEEAFLKAKKENTAQGYTVFLNSYRNSIRFRDAVDLLLLKVSQEPKPSNPTETGPTNKPPIPLIPTLQISQFEFITIKINDQGVIEKKQSDKNLSIVDELGGGMKMRLVKIPAGKFMMGSNRIRDEMPVHEVTIDEFYIGAYEVSQEQWRRVAEIQKVNIDLDKNPSAKVNGTLGDNYPVVGITWAEAREFCDRLNRHTGRLYALPTEAEWEYAARAETDSPFYYGPKISSDLVNFKASEKSIEGIVGVSRGRPVEVGSLNNANKWGVFDMHGNVSEWCEDGWVRHYDYAPKDGSARIGSQTQKVTRGGFYDLPASRVCSTCRDFSDFKDRFTGFRVVMRSKI